VMRRWMIRPAGPAAQASSVAGRENAVMVASRERARGPADLAVGQLGIAQPGGRRGSHRSQRHDTIMSREAAHWPGADAHAQLWPGTTGSSPSPAQSVVLPLTPNPDHLENRPGY